MNPTEGDFGSSSSLSASSPDPESMCLPLSASCNGSATPGRATPSPVAPQVRLRPLLAGSALLLWNAGSAASVSCRLWQGVATHQLAACSSVRACVPTCARPENQPSVLVLLLPQMVVLTGLNLSNAATRVSARFHGRYVPVEVMSVGPVILQHSSPPQPGAASPVVGGGLRGPNSLTGSLQWETMTVAVHARLEQPGLLLLECWCGKLLTSRKQLVVLEDGRVCTEISSGDAANLESVMASSDPSVERKTDDLLTDLGCWVEFMAGMRQVHAAASAAAAPSSAAKLLQQQQRQHASAKAGPTSSPSAVAAADGAGSGSPAAAGTADDKPGAGATAAAAVSAAGPEPDAQRRSSGGGGTGADGNASSSTPTATGGLGSVSRPMSLSRSSLSCQLLRACQHSAYQTQMVEVGIQLLEHACGCAWHATSTMLLSDLMSLGLSFLAIKRAANTDGMTLLHRAVCSGSQKMVKTVVGWGQEHGAPWNWSEADPASGITPLVSFAAVLKRSAFMPCCLLEHAHWCRELEDACDKPGPARQRVPMVP